MKYLILPLLALDCLLNVLCGGSFHQTLSATAWTVRDHRYFGWTYRFIDTMLFWQPNHCQHQAAIEQRYGSVWTAWQHV